MPKIKIVSKKSQKSNESKVDVEDMYQMMTQLEHILELPDTYIGSVEMTTIDPPIWTYDEKEETMAKKTIKIVPGLYKIFDEILVNAVDQWIRLKQENSDCQVKNIKVELMKKLEQFRFIMMVKVSMLRSIIKLVVFMFLK